MLLNEGQFCTTVDICQMSEILVVTVRRRQKKCHLLSQEARDAAKHPETHKAAPTNQE